jgi:predicted ester cyclase
MSIAINKTVVMQFYEDVANEGRFDLLDEIIAESAVVHTAVPGSWDGRAGFRAFLDVYLTAFPVQRTEVSLMVGEGDYVTVHHTHRGVNTGPFLGMPPTGRAIEIQGIETLRVVDGQIVEFWHQDDMLSLFIQLGIVPAPGAAVAA